MIIAIPIVRRLLQQERMILSGEIERIPSGFSEGISRLPSAGEMPQHHGLL
jgi:hypothetical protein